MLPNNGMHKATGYKPKGMKCKLDTGAGVYIMPLSTCKYVNSSELEYRVSHIDAHGQDRTTLKDYSGNWSNGMG